ncbi:hypothetical protein Tco_1146735 [Tanacetum coccineum]
MNPIVAQQTAIDNALVAPDDRVKIGKCNMRISTSKKPQKEPTYQVVLDALALSPCYPTFLITVDVPKIYMQEFRFTISKIKDSSLYEFNLNKKRPHASTLENLCCHHQQCLSGKISGFDKIRISRAQILWRMFYKKNVDFVKLIWEDFMFLIDNRDSSAKRKENLPYPRFTKAIIQHFISKDKSISMRNRMFMHIVRDDSVLGTLKFVAKREATPKKARKWKKPASPSKKRTLVITEEPAKKPAARKQPSGVQIKDTSGVYMSKKKAPEMTERNKGIVLLSEADLLEEVQIKKAIKRSKHETHLQQAGSSGNGASLEPEVPDEPKRKSIDTHEGTGLKPGVPDVSKADSSDSEYESWGVSDDDDDDQQGDDERTESDDDKSLDLNKTDDEEETHEDEFIDTPDDCVPTDDETDDVDDE